MAHSGPRAGPASAPPRHELRRRMAGRVLAAALFGLRDALDLRRRREETIVEEEPERSDDWLVWLDVDRPDRSLIIVPCADVPHDGVHHVADGGRPPPGTRGVGVGSEG